MSFNAAALKLMADKGLSAHDIAEIATALESDAPKADTAAERRRAWDRERKRERREAERASGGQSGGMSTGNPPDKGSNDKDILTSKRVKNSEPKGSSKKTGISTRLPSDWQPEPLTGKAAAMVASWQPGAMERELAKFKNYWLSKGANAARTDWQRTWVNWLISADEKQPRRTNERSSNPLRDAVSNIVKDCRDDDGTGEDAGPRRADHDDFRTAGSLAARGY